MVFRDLNEMGKSTSAKVESWLTQLPVIQSSQEVDFFVIDGFLLHEQDGLFQFVTGHLCFKLDSADVHSVQELPLVEGIHSKLGIPVRLSLRSGASLLGLYSSDPYQDLLCDGRKPFIFATRAIPCDVPHSKKFRQLEREFLERYNLI